MTDEVRDPPVAMPRGVACEPGLADLFAALRGRWWLVLAGGLAGLILAAGWVRLTPPEFEASMVVGPGQTLIEAPEQRGELGGLAVLQGLSLGVTE